MAAVALVGLLDRRGWVLLQERDEHAPVDPDRWSMVGGGVEPGESPAEGARRELREETGVDRDDLVGLGRHPVRCAVHGRDVVHLFTVRTCLTQDQIECHEGRQMLFVDPVALPDLDLTDATAALLSLVLA